MSLFLAKFVCYHVIVQLTAAVLVALLLVSNCIPETQAIPTFFIAFVKVGYKLIKKSYYAKCKLRGVIPSGLDCPKFAYGVGLSRGQAQSAAKFWANEVGSPGCGKYYGHCGIRKFIK